MMLSFLVTDAVAAEATSVLLRRDGRSLEADRAAVGGG